MGAAAQHADQLDAVDARQHQVDQVEAIAERRRVGQQLVAVGKAMDLDAEAAQVLRQELGVLDVVVDQRDRRGQIAGVGVEHGGVAMETIS